MNAQRVLDQIMKAAGSGGTAGGGSDIDRLLQGLLHQWVEQQLDQPLDAKALARHADSPQAAREIYLVSVAIVDEKNAMERAWLDELAAALGFVPELARELEQQDATADTA